MGLIIRTGIVVAVIWAMSPLQPEPGSGPGTQTPASRSAAAGSGAIAGEDMARLVISEASRHMTTEAAVSLWNRIDAADRQALARTVMDAMINDVAKTPARPRRTPEG